LTYINLANKALPENTEIQLHLAEVFLANGDTAKANRILDKIKPESLFQLSQLNELKSKLNI
jgi:thioredoxin-like negative regulator of GroEL